MGRLGARVAAEIIFVLHTALVVLLLLGWLLQAPFYYVYVAALSLTFLSQFIWRYCVFTTWEFYFRRIADPSIEKTPYYLSYYAYKLFPGAAAAVSDAFIDRISLIFLSVSILAAALWLAGYW